MEGLIRALEIGEKLETLYSSDYIVFLIAFIFIVWVAFFHDSKKVLSIGLAVLILGSASLSLNIYSNIKSLESEVEAIEAKGDWVSKEHTVSVETTKILVSEPVSYTYCLHTLLKEDEECTFVEFVSDKEVTQVFIPLKKTTYADADNPLIIEYVDISKEDRAQLNKYLKYGLREINGKHNVYTGGWSYGISIEPK